MKKLFFPLVFTGFIALSIVFLVYQNSTSIKPLPKMSKTGLLAMQAGYQFSKLRNPRTGLIPVGIRSGNQHLLFNFSDFPAGVYYLSFDTGKEVVVEKKK